MPKKQKTKKKPRVTAAAIIEAMPIGMVVHDLEGKVLQTNEAAEKMFGYKRKEGIGKSVIDFIAEEDRPRALESMSKGIREGFSRGFECIGVRKDGSKIHSLIDSTLMRDSKGNPSSVVISFRDITELKHAEEKEKQAIKLAEKSKRELAEKMAEDLRKVIKTKTQKIREVERLRERFMADASHELRTPLAVLQTNLDLLSQLSESKSSQDIKDLIEGSKNRAQHLAAIIEELSLLSKGKKLEELREIIKLATISEETIEELQPLADTKNINCYIKVLYPDLEVMGDETMLRKVIRNLVSNAIKYGRKRGMVKITLTKQKREVELEVLDNGIGIPKKDLPHMFERFYRVKRGGSKERSEGIGLGLAICKWIVELHGGRIKVESKCGKGSKFKVFLPLKGTRESRMGLWDYKLRRISAR